MYSPRLQKLYSTKGPRRRKWKDFVRVVPCLYHPEMSSCHLWLGAKTPKGYGMIHRNDSKEHYAHRYIYEKRLGPINPDYELHHVCHNSLCVNVDHLKLVTPGQNIQQRRRKVACIYGHPYNEENTYTDPNGTRHCIICQRECVRRFRAKLVTI